MAIALTNQQARRFMLLKQGLLGEYKFTGRQGVLDFIRQAGCIQFDPVDVCGRNADISLRSRVKGYTKEMLDELLYKERRLIDYFDKNLSIFSIEDVPALYSRRLSGGYAEAYDSRGGDAVKQVMPLIRQLIKERGHISAKEIEIDETIVWHWGTMTSLPRAALESMYFRGELIIHHKTGTNKSYAFIDDHVPAGILNAAPPWNSEEERLAWYVRRRIGAAGLLWNRAGNAWLGLRSLKSAERNAAFSRLLGGGEIIEAAVEGIKDPLYLLSEDKTILDETLSGKDFMPRCEFIAPLDSLIWDRRLIKELFGFDYTWEIYTPAAKRKFGAYVLPVLYDDRFVGRIEAVRDSVNNVLNVKNIWFEECVKQTKKLHAAISRCVKRFTLFNGCEAVQGFSEALSK